MIAVKILILSFLMILFSSSSYCQKNILKTSPLNGTWIEISKKTDTIVFASEFDGQNSIFELKRGFRIADGNKLPDYYSGPYWYKLTANSISLYWFLSNGSFQSYYFKLITRENKMLIGNFFKNPENKNKEQDTLVFIKIK